MSLYLKYRPQHFGDVVGQSHVTDILLAQAQANSFSHNYLLYGPRGTGKTTTARLLAKIANASTDDLANDPISQLIDAGQTLDFVEIDAASHTGVDNIREEIIDKALYPPTHLKKKVYVIDEVHMLSKGAFNALLKIMEEPPSYLLFVLATTEINKVPDTIVSRCQVFNFKRIGIDDIVARLVYIADKESIEYEEEGLRLIAKLSSGALRDAIKYLEQVSMLGKVTAEHVAKFLGVVSDAVIQKFITTLTTGTYEEVCEQLDALYTTGTDLATFAKDILLWLDEHFMDDPATYSRLAGVCREIYADIRAYPYPLLVYKSKLFYYFQGPDAIVAPVKKKTKEVPVVKKEEKVIEREIKEETAQEIPMKSEENEQKESKESVSAVSATAIDSEELMQRIIAVVDKIMIKSILKKNTIIDSLENDVMTIIVINQQYHATLQKTETVIYLQNIISEVRGTPTQLKSIYMTKEAYLQQALGKSV